MKLIALDMDGVVNSDTHYRKYLQDTIDRFKAQFDGIRTHEADVEAVKAAREQFKKDFNHNMSIPTTELVFPELAARVSRICQETDSYILWSSTWRRIKQYEDIETARDMFNRRGLPGDRLIDYSPDLKADEIRVRTTRGEEIAHWISNTADYDITKYAVLDDRYDAGDYILDIGRFFWINPYYGITDSDVEGIIEFLNS